MAGVQHCWLDHGILYRGLTRVFTPEEDGIANPKIVYFFCPPGTEKLNKSPRQIKSSDNSNLLHIFNNYAYTDFRRAYKHILIPSYLTRVI